MVIGFVAGAGGGMLVGMVVNKLANLFMEDDCIISARLLNAVVVNMIIDYMLNEDEVNKLIERLDVDSKKINKFQMSIRQSDRQYHDILIFLEPYFEEVINSRSYISEKTENDAFAYEEMQSYA